MFSVNLSINKYNEWIDLSDGYCTSFGKLGICSAKGNCKLDEIRRNTFPYIRHHFKGLRSSNPKQLIVNNYVLSLFIILTVLEQSI